MLQSFSGDRCYSPTVSCGSTSRETVSAIRRARALLRGRRKPVRLHVAATRFSMGESWMSDGVILDTRRLLEPIERCDFAGGTVFSVAAGWTIHEVQTVLQAHGFALADSSNFTGATYIGACQTSSHGCGLGFGPMGSQVCAYELVDADGKVRGVQRTTDRVLSGLGYDAGEILTHDGVFRALGVSLGALGVITRVWIQPVREFWVHHRRWLSTWAEARHLMANGEPYRWDSQGYLVSPYPRRDGEYTCSIGTHARMSEKSPTLPVGGESFMSLLNQGFNLLKFIPLFARSPRVIPRILEKGFGVFTRDREIQGPAHEMLGQHFYGFPPRGVGLELALPYGTPESCAAAAAFVDALIEQIAVLRRSDRFVGGYVSIRFSKRWDASLSLTHGADTCFVELLMLNGTPRGRETLIELERNLRHWKPRMHLGLIHGTTRDDVEAAYPGLEEFLEIRRGFDPDEIFANGLTDRLGITGGSPALARAAVG